MARKIRETGRDGGRTRSLREILERYLEDVPEDHEEKKAILAGAVRISADLAARRMSDKCLSDLVALDQEIDRAIASGNVERYLEYNYRFHFSLYEQADAPVLSKLSQSLWLQSGPALRIVCGRFGTANLPDKHDEALTALREGDPARAAQAIGDDIRQGIGQVRLTLSD